ncbi:hypothetical protein WG66_008005 [Moniliophthora roreri]|nr:hypothetical protein WG66_008005 [Moniliophthora roreri]
MTTRDSTPRWLNLTSPATLHINNSRLPNLVKGLNEELFLVNLRLLRCLWRDRSRCGIEGERNAGRCHSCNSSGPVVALSGSAILLHVSPGAYMLNASTKLNIASKNVP